jgi:uncharacterized protein (TIRG00374 family)
VKKSIVRAIKIIIPIVILGWLFYSLSQDDPENFQQVVSGKKNWPRIGIALGLCLTGVSLSFTRWYVLIRGLGVEFRWIDAYRLGFIGYFFNFVSLGSVGGDLFKALFVLREQPGRRTEVVGSILVDRVVGLYTLLLLASLSTAWITWQNAGGSLAPLRFGIWVSFAIGTVVLVLFLANFLSLRWVAGWLANFPRIAATLFRLESGFQLYRKHPLVLALGILLGGVAHSLHGLCLYLLATSLFQVTPTVVEHYVMWPVAGAISSLPIAPAGVGTFELALKELYVTLPKNAAEILPQTGTIVGLAYRILTMIVAGVGVALYWVRKAEVDRALVLSP